MVYIYLLICNFDSVLKYKTLCVAYKKTTKKSVKNAEIFAYVKIFCYLCGGFVCSTYICPNGNIVVLK